MKFEFKIRSNEFLHCISQKALVWERAALWCPPVWILFDWTLSFRSCPSCSCYRESIKHVSLNLSILIVVCLPWHTLFSNVTEHFIQHVWSHLTDYNRDSLFTLEVFLLLMFHDGAPVEVLCRFCFSLRITLPYPEPNTTILFLQRPFMAASRQAQIVFVLLSANRRRGKRDRTASFKWTKLLLDVCSIPPLWPLAHYLHQDHRLVWLTVMGLLVIAQCCVFVEVHTGSVGGQILVSL